MKLAVIGSRTFNDYRLLTNQLNNLTNISCIVSGGAKGADSLAEKYAGEFNIPTTIFKAEWSKYGRAAGPKRNLEIIKNSNLVVAFWDGKSKGTLSSINLAKKHGVKVQIVKIAA